MVDEHSEARPAVEPTPVEQAEHPAETAAISRIHQRMEHRAAVGCLIVVTVLVITVLVWGFVAFR